MTTTVIPGFKGQVFARGDAAYSERSYQYASSSHGTDGSMSPAAVLYPSDDADVIAAVQYAEAHGLAIAIRTGGHQYSGASSTTKNNLQLDLSNTYPEFEWNNSTGLLRVGISHALRDFNRQLGDLALFVPHGQCSHVHVGGHVQSGGYGQLGRSFGLFADHVESFQIILASGEKRTVTRASDPELFFAVLGGSPGNFGVLTHITIRPHRDDAHPNARGFKAWYPYSRDAVERLLDVMVEMADDEDFPGDFDYCVTVLSESQLVLPHIFPGLDEQMRLEHPELYGQNDLPLWPAGIIVYAQWANLKGKGQAYDRSFFDKIKKAAGPSAIPAIQGKIATFKPGFFFDDDQPEKMSALTKGWVFTNVREFDLPYEKRTYVTNSRTLAADGWSAWVADRIDDIQGDPLKNCKLSVQIQHFGGKNSQFRNLGPTTGTAHSWREDSTIVCVLDCFYRKRALAPHARERALAWQQQNDEAGVLKGFKFCREDRRVLWGSYGDRNLANVWPHYYDSQAKYDRLCATKKKVDPNGVFTPNSFCVGVAPTGLAPKAAALETLSGAIEESLAAPEETVEWDDKALREANEARESAAVAARG